MAAEIIIDTVGPGEDNENSANNEAEDQLKIQVRLPIISTRPCFSCESKASKYRCPRCDVTSCSLDCVKAHKSANVCSGIREKTAYVALRDFDERHLLNDYRLLSEVDDSAKRFANQIENSSAPNSKFSKHGGFGFCDRLRKACGIRGGPRIAYCPDSFEKRKTNTTKINFEGEIEWRLSLNFTIDKEKVHEETIENVHEKKTIREILRQILTPKKNESKLLDGFREKDFHVLLKNESKVCNIQGNFVRFYLLNCETSLGSNLLGNKFIIEHPTLLVVPASEDLEFYLKTTKMSETEKAKAAEEKENSKTFGLFSGENEGGSSSEDEETEKAASAQKPDLKRPKSEEEKKKDFFDPSRFEGFDEWNQKRRKVWKHAQDEHDDRSMIHSFLQSHENEESKDSKQKNDEPMEETPEMYEKYYDYYLQYYKGKYGLKEGEEEADKSESSVVQKDEEKPKEPPKKSGLLVAAYADSDSE